MVWQTGKTEHHPISFYQDDILSNWYENQVYRLPSGEIVAVFDDITDQKQAEQALQKTTSDLKQNIKELEPVLKDEHDKPETDEPVKLEGPDEKEESFDDIPFEIRRPKKDDPNQMSLF